MKLTPCFGNLHLLILKLIKYSNAVKLKHLKIGMDFRSGKMLQHQSPNNIEMHYRNYVKEK